MHEIVVITDEGGYEFRIVGIGAANPEWASQGVARLVISIRTSNKERLRLNASFIGRRRGVDGPSAAGRGVRFARKRLDLSPLDVVRGLGFCTRQRRRRDVLASVASAWDPAENAVVTLSVRSGFDLLLGAVDWAPGSEVVFSAVTIPHLAALVRSHGYVPVSVDLDLQTLEVDASVVEGACTERTRAVVIAQLFGARADLTALASLAAARGLLLVEDCAQCYDGADRRLGPVDIAMYSFGTIKTATCLGGAVLLVRDPVLARMIRTRQDSYPTQPTSEYFWKLLKAAVLLMIGVPTVYQAFSRAIQALGLDYDAAIRRISREFDDRDLLVRIRRRPCTALLAMMAFRFASYDPACVLARRQAGERLVTQLAPHVVHLGSRAQSQTHWLFPIVSSAPARLIAAGRAVGFDLTAGSSTLVALDQNCRQAAGAMSKVVYVPICSTMQTWAVRDLAGAINEAELARP
jgi:perosamine synthetase